MVSAGRQMLGLALATIGFLGSIVVCALPMWKVSGSGIWTQTIWEGLWMSCLVQSMDHMQCKVYHPQLELTLDVQVARALTIISIMAGVFGLLLGVAGSKCTNFLDDEVAKSKVALAAGVAFIMAGVLLLVAVCWTANAVIQILLDPVPRSYRLELGTALYIGWFTARLLLLGGVLLCCSSPPRYDAQHSNARYVEGSRANV